MPDKQEQDLTLGVAMAVGDYVRTVATPGAVPESQDITFDNFQKSITTLGSVKSPTMQVRTTATFGKTSSTALADITGLSVNLVAGHNYRFTARLHTTSAATGGVKTAMSGTAAYSLVIYDMVIMTTTALTHARGNAFADSAGTTAGTVDYIEISGFIACSVNGTLTVQFAQNASDGTASVVQVGSSLFVDEVV